MSAFLLSQIVVSLAICLDLVSFQFKDRRKILLTLALAVFLIATHFALLGLWTAAAMAMLGSIRFLISIFTTARWVLWTFLSLNLVVAVATYIGPISVLAAIAGCMHTWASFQPSDKRLRLWMMLATSLWLSHNIWAGTPMGVVLEAMFLLSNLLGYYRHYWAPSRRQRSQLQPDP